MVETSQRMRPIQRGIDVKIPSMLRNRCGGKSQLRLKAGTIDGALSELERDYPQIYRAICDETGTLRPHVNLFVNSSLVQGIGSSNYTFLAGDVLWIMPAVSGG